MDLRTYIATQIAAGILAKGIEHCQEAGDETGYSTSELFAKVSVRLADALIKELGL